MGVAPALSPRQKALHKIWALGARENLDVAVGCFPQGASPFYKDFYPHPPNPRRDKSRLYKSGRGGKNKDFSPLPKVGDGLGVRGITKMGCSRSALHLCAGILAVPVRVYQYISLCGKSLWRTRPYKMPVDLLNQPAPTRPPASLCPRAPKDKRFMFECRCVPVSAGCSWALAPVCSWALAPPMTLYVRTFSIILIVTQLLPIARGLGKNFLRRFLLGEAEPPGGVPWRSQGKRDSCATRETAQILRVSLHS